MLRLRSIGIVPGAAAPAPPPFETTVFFEPDCRSYPSEALFFQPRRGPITIDDRSGGGRKCLTK